jgi:hypothetical protein
MTSLWRILPHDRQVSHPYARTRMRTYVYVVYLLNKALFHDDSSRFLSLGAPSTLAASVSVQASLAFVF